MGDGDDDIIGWKKGRRKIGFAACRPTWLMPEKVDRISVGDIVPGR